MHALKFVCAVFAAALLTFSLHSPAQATAVPDPVEQVKPVIAEITTMLTEEDYKQLPREEQFDRFLTVAKKRFDFDEMSKRVLGPQWNSLSAEQKDLFKERFARLLGYTYMDKIDTYAGEGIQYEIPRIRGGRAEVRTAIQFKNGSVPIFYIMQLKDSEWMAYDLVVENISLVRNYMEQLRSILQKNGFDGLMKQISDKIDQLKATKK